MTSQVRLPLLALLTLLLSGCSTMREQQTPATGVINIVSQPYSFSIPIKSLEGASILSPLNIGVSVFFSRNKYFQIDPLYNSDIGYDSLSMHEYPKLIWGEESSAQLSAEQAEDFAGLRRLYAGRHPVLEAPIKLQDGYAYFAYGEENSSVLFVHRDFTNVLVQVTVKNMTRDEVMNLIINTASDVKAGSL